MDPARTYFKLRILLQRREEGFLDPGSGGRLERSGIVDRVGSGLCLRSLLFALLRLARLWLLSLLLLRGFLRSIFHLLPDTLGRQSGGHDCSCENESRNKSPADFESEWRI